MKLALIPPFSYLEDTARTDYQLMLPHLVSHPEYEKTYRDLCADPNQYVILDNGVAEGKQIEFKEILDIADNFGVDEVVLPDVMKDAVATMNAASRAIYVHGMHYPIKFMYVVQGTTYDEVYMSAKFALSFSSVGSIGIPRHLIETLGESDARWRIASYLLGKLDVYGMSSRDIHFLGMNPTAPREMELGPEWIRERVRGFDTSAPYNFAYYASSMTGTKAPCKRPKKYFEKPEEEFQSMMVYKNIEYLEGCAG